MKKTQRLVFAVLLFIICCPVYHLANPVRDSIASNSNRVFFCGALGMTMDKVSRLSGALEMRQYNLKNVNRAYLLSVIGCNSYFLSRGSFVMTPIFLYRAIKGKLDSLKINDQ